MQNQLARNARTTAILLFSTVAAAFAQTNQPAWLTEASIAIRGGYDNNVFMSGCDPRYLPVYAGPVPGSVTAEKNHGSFFEMLTPKVAADFAKLLGGDNLVQTLTFSYAPDFVAYDDAPSEDYIAHRLAATIVLKCHDLAFALDEGFTDIEGRKYAATYPGKYFSSYGHGFVRERRDQFQDRTTATLTYDQESWFFRPTASLLGYDLHTDLIAIPSSSVNYGYLNYVDRSDLNGGADLGYKLNKDLAVTLGYRAGEQYQQRLPFAIDPYGQTSDNDYQRVLLGIEGKLTSWLSGKLQAGPDFRSYDAAAPVREHDPVTFYGEGVLTAIASAYDTIAFNYRQWRWVSSTGCVPYNDNTFGLTYKHQFTDRLMGRLGFCVQSSDYNVGEVISATPIPNYRNDWMYTAAAGVQYALTSRITLDLAYAATLGRNAQGDADLSQASGSQLPATKREFDDQVVSLGVQYKF